jgi:hypothetical protein
MQLNIATAWLPRITGHYFLIGGTTEFLRRCLTRTSSKPGADGLRIPLLVFAWRNCSQLRMNLPATSRTYLMPPTWGLASGASSALRPGSSWGFHPPIKLFRLKVTICTSRYTTFTFFIFWILLWILLLWLSQPQPCVDNKLRNVFSIPHPVTSLTLHCVIHWHLTYGKWIVTNISMIYIK